MLTPFLDEKGFFAKKVRHIVLEFGETHNTKRKNSQSHIAISCLEQTISEQPRPTRRLFFNKAL